MLVQEKTSIYFAAELSLKEISYVMYVHALICAVGMRIAILSNHLKIGPFRIAFWLCVKASLQAKPIL